jgi:hypothetical protein
MATKQTLVSIVFNWPLVIVGFGMALTVVWIAALAWFFVAATGYAGAAPIIV